MIQPAQHSAEEQRSKPVKWTRNNLDVLSYAFREGVVKSDSCLAGHDHEHQAFDCHNNLDDVTNLAKNRARRRRIGNLLYRDAHAHFDELKETLTFHFCGSSIRVPMCVVFSRKYSLKVPDQPLQHCLLLGYLRQLRTQDWGQGCFPNWPEKSQGLDDDSARIMSDWMCQKQMRFFHERRILVALIALAQRLADDNRYGSLSRPTSYRAQLLVTKATDTDFIYHYAADLTRESLELLRKPVRHVQDKAHVVITETMIPFAPHDSFRRRMLYEIDAARQGGHVGDREIKAPRRESRKFLEALRRWLQKPARRRPYSA